MKKQVYLTIIGIGAILALIGFIPGGMSAIWGILIVIIAGALYYLNRKNEAKVAERLKGEEEISKPEGTTRSAETETSAEPNSAEPNSAETEEKEPNEKPEE